MTKRQSDREESPYSKRQKLAPPQDASLSEAAPEEILSCNDLKQLLTFEPTTARIRHIVQKFKVFLDTASYSEDAQDKAVKRSILHEFISRQP